MYTSKSQEYYDNDEEYYEDFEKNYQKSEKFDSNGIMVKEISITPYKNAQKNIETLTHSKDKNNNSISIYQKMMENKQDQSNTTTQNPPASNESEQIQEEFLSYDFLLINLKLLSNLGKDEKLLNNFGSLDIDNRYLPTFRRWFTSDSRANTYEMLKKIINSADYHSELLIKQLMDDKKNNTDVKHKLDILTSDIIGAQTGFRNLIITYRDDEAFLSKLDLCTDSLSVRRFKNLNFK